MVVSFGEVVNHPDDKVSGVSDARGKHLDDKASGMSNAQGEYPGDEASRMRGAPGVPLDNKASRMRGAPSVPGSVGYWACPRRALGLASWLMELSPGLWYPQSVAPLFHSWYLFIIYYIMILGVWKHQKLLYIWSHEQVGSHAMQRINWPSLVKQMKRKLTFIPKINIKLILI